MMQSLATRRCLNHAEREAVARCPQCTQFFCRECITEYDDRVLCSACLKKLARVPLTRRAGFATFLRLSQCVIGIGIVWFFFFVIGEKLAREPNTFHRQRLWHVPWLDQK